MELDDAELELLAHSVGITRDSLARKLRRLPRHMRATPTIELEDNEALLRRLYDEQKARRSQTA